MKICKTIVNGIAPAITHPRAWAALAALALGLLPLSAQAVTPQTTIQPSTGITALIETNGIFSDMGTIDLFAGNFAPGGSAIASGQLLPISSNTALFSLIGTYYGGNGSSNFALPNLNGRAIIGTGQGLGLSNRFLGETTGVPQVTLSNTQMPVSVGGLGQAFTNVQPSLAVNYYISAAGVYPTGGGGGGNAQPFLGQIFATASAASPGSGGLSNSWIPADGRLLPISQNTALFSILGTTYGGNGTSTFGELVTLTATVSGRDAGLTLKEFRLLELLMRHPGQVFSRVQIVNNLWDFEFDGASNVVDVHVKNLRKKVERLRPAGGKQNEFIETVRGVGYCLKG